MFGRLEIGVQEARKRRPVVSDDALLELAKAVHGRLRDDVSHGKWHSRT